MSRLVYFLSVFVPISYPYTSIVHDGVVLTACRSRAGHLCCAEHCHLRGCRPDQATPRWPDQALPGETEVLCTALPCVPLLPQSSLQQHRTRQ